MRFFDILSPSSYSSFEAQLKKFGISRGPLNRRTLSAHIRVGPNVSDLVPKTVPVWPQARERNAMEGKARFIFPVIISAVIVFVVSAVVTFTNIGLRADFVPRWLKAFVTGWPVAAVLAFFAVPHVRRATDAIVRLIDGQA
jgi:hypothetical protein